MAKQTVETEFRLTAQDRASQVFRTLNSQVKGLDASLASAAAAFGALGGAAALGSAALAANQAIQDFDALGKAAQRAGVTVETLSKLEFAAKLSDVSLEKLGAALTKLSVNMLDTQAGTGEARAAFAALKVSVTDAAGALRPTEVVLEDLAEIFGKMEDGAGKTALAVKVFGRAGAELLPFLNLGKAGIRDLTEEAKKLGLEVSTSTSKAAEEFNDNLTTLSESIKGAARVFTAPFLPALTNITKAMREAAKEGGFFKGILAGIQTTITGTDLDKANKEFGELTDALVTLQFRRDRATTEKDAQILDRRIANIRQRLSALQILRDQLEGKVNAFGEPIVKLPEVKVKADRLVDQDALKRQAESFNKERAAAITKAVEDEQAALDAVARVQARVATKAFDDTTAQNKELQAQGRAWKDLIDPIQKYRDQLKEIEKLVAKGVLTQDEALLAREKVEDSIEAINRLGVSLGEADDIGKQLGLTFSSAFEDAIVQGKKFSDVLKGIGQDIARIVIRKSITEPLGSAISEIFKTKGGKGSSILGDILSAGKSLLGFADGGSFRVGGIGGTDSQLVAFRASPNERVTIEKPGQQAGIGRGGDSYQVTVAPTYHLSAVDMQGMDALLARHQRTLQALVEDGYARAGRRSGAAFA